MRYFRKDDETVFAYEDETQSDLIEAAQELGYQEITDGSWPPKPVVVNPLVVSASQALVRSDTSVLRILAAGIAVPADFVTYRAALRAIVNGTDKTSTELPAAPTDFPAGT